jgi:hypothetical protein
MNQEILSSVFGSVNMEIKKIYHLCGSVSVEISEYCEC